MKKYFLSMLAMAAMLLTTSCSKDDAIVETTAEDVMVSFNIATPELATRAVPGLGDQATALYYAVYDAGGNLLKEISKINNPQEIKGSTNVSIKLVKGRKYSFIFWAENQAGSMCSIDWVEQTLTVDPEKANQEGYDAFWAYEDLGGKPVSGRINKTIKLYRPFAQLNIGTNDKGAAAKAGMTVKSTQITVTTPTTMNLVDGTTDDEDTFTYAYEDIATIEGMDFPKSGYSYLALNYLLVEQVGAEEDPTLIDVEFGYKDTEGKEYDRIFYNAPIRRNYRTNIYGSILTNSANFKVEIVPGFDGEINPEDHLKEVLKNGGVITLFSDMTLNESLTIPADKEVVINLNGNTLTAESSTIVKGELSINNGVIVTKMDGRGIAFETKGSDAKVNLTEVEMTVNGNNNGITIESWGTVADTKAVINLDNTRINAVGNNAHAIFVVQYVKELEVNVTNESSITGKQAIFIEKADDAVINIDETSYVQNVHAPYGNVTIVYKCDTKPETAGGANFIFYTDKAMYDLKKVLENGGEITLSSDMTLEESLSTPADANVVIDLNGKTLTIASANELAGNLTLKDGNVSVNIPSPGMIGAFKPTEDGHVTIEDANVTVARGNSLVAVYEGDRDAMNAVIDVKNSTITVEQGGNGVCIPFDVNYVELNLVNSKINGPAGFMVNETITNALITLDETSSIDNIEIGGGDVVIVYKGEKPTVNGGNVTYYNYAEATVSSVDEMNAALVKDKGAYNIKMSGRLLPSAAFSHVNKNIIDGQDNYIWGGTFNSINTSGGIIQNLGFWQAEKAINIVGQKSKVVLNNVKVVSNYNCNYAIHADEGNGSGLEATDCEFYSHIAYVAALGNAKFTNCTFGANKNGSTNLTAYAPTEFVGCEFKSGYPITAKAAITFENCTLDGVAITADNIASLVTEGAANATIK